MVEDKPNEDDKAGFNKNRHKHTKQKKSHSILQRSIQTHRQTNNHTNKKQQQHK